MMINTKIINNKKWNNENNDNNIYFYSSWTKINKIIIKKCLKLKWRNNFKIIFFSFFNLLKMHKNKNYFK